MSPEWIYWIVFISAVIVIAKVERKQDRRADALDEKLNDILDSINNRQDEKLESMHQDIKLIRDLIINSGK
jgi:archaellum component FlaG (FlaF/FlaG flagellin family)